MEQCTSMSVVFRRIAEENDPAAFAIFFRAYHPKLLRLARLFVRTDHQAEDVVSDVMVRLLKRRQRVFRMDNLEGYLFISVKHQALNHMKKKQVKLRDDEAYTPPESPDTQAVDPLQQLLDNELREMIRKTVESMPPRRRTVYHLVKDEGLKYRQVAELLDISERTVEHHLEAAIKDLRQVVQHYVSNHECSPSE